MCILHKNRSNGRICRNSVVVVVVVVKRKRKRRFIIIKGNVPGEDEYVYKVGSETGERVESNQVLCVW
jgi:hypothetical protein